jgi:hypothetical protein
MGTKVGKRMTEKTGEERGEEGGSWQVVPRSSGGCDATRAGRSAPTAPGCDRPHLECRYCIASMSWRKMVRASASL